MEKQILITGANGQLGSELKLLAAENGLKNLHVTDADTLDIANGQQVEQFFADHQLVACINAAAYTAVDKAEAEAERAFQINAEGPGLMAKACQAKGIPLLHISTDFVFAGDGALPLTENDPTQPLSIYGQSKLKGEQLALLHCQETTVFRTSWLYSSFGNNFVKTMLRLAIDRRELNVVYDQVGTPTYARDLAAAVIIWLAQKEKPKGVFHFSNEGVASWYDFAQEIFDMAGQDTVVHPIRSVQYPTPARRPSFSVLDKAKYKNTFGQPIRHWKTALAECLAAMDYPTKK